MADNYPDEKKALAAVDTDGLIGERTTIAVPNSDLYNSGDDISIGREQYQRREKGGFVDELKRDTHELSAKARQQWHREFEGYGTFEYAAMLLPCLKWLRTYRLKEWLWHDCIAGLSVGALLIPQSMSYAGLANLPYQYGLYAAFMPVIVYKLMGSSPQLAVGPVAVISLLLGNGLQEIAGYASKDPNKPENPALQFQMSILALKVSMMVGAIEFLIGFFRLGFLTNFLSHAVISGFCTGAAVTICMQQVKDMLGLNSGRATEFIPIIESWIKYGNTISWATTATSAAWLFLLLGAKYIPALVARRNASLGKKLGLLVYFGPITVVLLSILFSYVFDFKSKGIKVVGSIPAGLPTVTVEHFTSNYFPLGPTLRLAGLVALVGIMESISIAKVLAEKNNYTFSPDADLRALGIGNFVGSMFGGYAATGSFSRSSLADLTGCKTQLSGLFTSILIMVVLLALTKPFELMPRSAMGAIIAVSVAGLFDWWGAATAWRVSKKDFVVWMTSFVITAFVNAEVGLGVAIGLALLLNIAESAFPYTAELGRIPTTTIYRDVKRHNNTLVIPGLLTFRVDAPLYFGNVVTVLDRVNSLIRKSSAQPEGQIHYLVLDFTAVTHVDATAVRHLQRVIEKHQGDGIVVVVAGASKNVIKVLDRGQVYDLVGAQWFFMQTYEAVRAATDDGVKRGVLSGKEAARIPSSSVDSPKAEK